MIISEETYKGFLFQTELIGDLYRIRIYNESGTQIGRAKGNVLEASLNGAAVPAMALGAVNIQPPYRRNGLASHCFRILDRFIEERGCVVSYLHPFSFNYYRSFGYERIADHKVIKTPMSALSHLPRYHALKKITPDDGTAELETAYNRFCAGRNAIFFRHDTVSATEGPICETYTTGEPFAYIFNKNEYYLSYDESGAPDGYIRLRNELTHEHHHLFGTVHVDEICYASKEALYKLLGFIRMYEGESDDIIFHNVGMAPEVELALRDYKYISIQTVPDLMARFHDVEAALKNAVYPGPEGSFSVRISDCERSPFSRTKTEGCWQVKYKDGKGDVTKLNANASCDLELTMPAFSQLIHGFTNYDRTTAAYTEGVTMHGDCDDFFRAFPNRPCGMYDLF